MANRFTLVLTTLAGLGLAATGPITAAHAGQPFQVNTTTSGNQWLNSIARLADGKFVVVWESDNARGARGEIEAQLYSSNGAKYGVNITVTIATGNHTPVVAALTDGSFVVAWVNNRVNPKGIIVGQRVAANGTFIGEPFRISSRNGAQQTPAIGSLTGGGFVVVWASSLGGLTDDSYDIVGRQFAADGTAVGGQFRVNHNTSGAQLRSSVAGASNGGFIVVWDSAEDNGSGGAIYFIRGQSYAADNSRSDRPFVVKRSGAELKRPRIAILADSGFVVVWEAMRNHLTAFNVYAQRYSSAGTQVGGLIPVAVARKDDENPTVAALALGGFVVSWADDNFSNIAAQRFAADGSPTGKAFRVNAKTEAIRDWPGIAPDASGGFVISWDGQDQSLLGVFARVFKPQD